MIGTLLARLPAEQADTSPNFSEWGTEIATHGDNDIFWLHYDRTSGSRKVRVMHLKLEDGMARQVSDAFVDEPTSVTDSWMTHWNIGIDEKGFLHVTPNFSEHDKTEGCGVYRSKKRLDATEFEVHDAEETCLPGNGFARLRFFYDNRERLHAVYRAIAQYPSDGKNPHGLMIARYDVDSDRWISFGKPMGIEDSDGCEAIIWEQNNPASYYHKHNHWFSHVGFDKNNALHVWVMPNGEAGKDHKPSYAVYLFTDDSGETWYNRDGSVVGAPMRMQSAPTPDIAYHFAPGDDPWNMAAGVMPSGDYFGFVRHDEGEKYRVLHSNATGGSFSEREASEFPTAELHEWNFIVYDREGTPTMVWRDGFRRFYMDDGELGVKHHALVRNRFQPEEKFFRRTGRLLGRSAYNDEPSSLWLYEFVPNKEEPYDVSEEAMKVRVAYEVEEGQRRSAGSSQVFSAIAHWEESDIFFMHY
eukprot:Polyplicarium_translucidae@DN1971_c0_g1_i2.p1